MSLWFWVLDMNGQRIPEFSRRNKESTMIVLKQDDHMTAGHQRWRAYHIPSLCLVRFAPPWFSMVSQFFVSSTVLWQQPLHSPCWCHMIGSKQLLLLMKRRGRGVTELLQMTTWKGIFFHVSNFYFKNGVKKKSTFYNYWFITN